jgi:hypothetical protein
MLKCFEGDTVAMIAASPAYLDDINSYDYDKYNNIRKCFFVNIENDVV